MKSMLKCAVGHETKRNNPNPHLRGKAFVLGSDWIQGKPG